MDVGNERGQRWENGERENKTKEREKKKVKAARLFRPCGLVPHGIAEHSVKILHFKINHSRLGTKGKTRTFTHMFTLTHANKRTFTHNMLQAMSSVLVQRSARQLQNVTAVSDSGLL